MLSTRDSPVDVNEQARRSFCGLLKAGPSLLVLGLVMELGAAAGAADSQANPLMPEDDDHVSFEAGMYVFRRDSASWQVLTPRLGGSYAPTDELVQRLDWGVAWGRDASPGESRTQLSVGNPAVSGAYRIDFPSARLLLGAGIALPFAQEGDSSADARLAAITVSGLKNYWLWLPTTLTIIAPVRWDILPTSALRLSADGALAIYIGTADSGQDDVGLQLGGEAA